MSDVVPVAEARAALTKTLRGFRDDPQRAEPVVLGSHRVPDAVLVPFAQYERLVEASERHRPGSIRAEVSRRRALIERLARANRIVDVRVFGSVARGDEHPDSDLDLLITPADDATYFDFAQFELDVEALLGLPVQAVSVRGLDAERDATILAEAVPL